MSRYKGYVSLIALLIAMISIQCGAAFAKTLFPLIGATGVTTLRAGLAAILLAVLLRPWRGPLQPRELGAAALYGLSLGAMNIAFYLSLERIPLGLAVALEFVGPLSLALLHSRAPSHFLWVLLAALGIYLILPLRDMESQVNWPGALLALAAGAFWATYIIFGQKAGKTLSSARAASLGMVFAALVVAPFGFLSAGAKLWEPSILLSGFIVAVLCSAIPYSLEMIALKDIPTRTFGLLMSIEPAIAASSGWIFLSEDLSPTQLFAISCIIVAAAGSTFISRERPHPVEALAKPAESKKA